MASPAVYPSPKLWRFRRWLTASAPLAPLLFGYWLRVYHLGLPAAMGDDAFSLQIARQNLSGLFALSKNEPHPPLFYLLLHFWQLPAGTGELAGRYLSLWFGVLGLAALYRFGLRMGGRWVAVLALSLAAINPFLIAFSQQVRMYTMVVALTTLSSYLLARLVAHPGRSAWLAYWLCSLAAVYSHFFGFFVLGAQGVFVVLTALFNRRKRSLVRPWFLGFGALLACYAPWVIVAHRTLMTYTNGLVHSYPLPKMVRLLVPAFMAANSSLLLPPWLWALTGVLLIAGLFIPRRWLGLGFPERLFLGSLLVAPILAVWVISLVRPMFFERYMVVIEPAFLLALAAGIASLTRRFWPAGLALLAGLFVPAAQALPPYYGTVAYATSANIRQMLAFIQDSARPGAAVIVNLPPSDPMYRYYVPQEPEYFIPNPSADQASATVAELSNVLATHNEVWFTPWDFDHTAFVEKWLDEHAFRVSQRWFANAEIIRYESPRPPTAATPSAATFIAPDAQIQLRSFELYSDRVAPGQPLLFSLEWQTNAPISERYKVFAHLLDEQNHVITQRDDEPVANKRPTTTWKPGELIADNYALIVPPGTPAGRYQIEVGLYAISGSPRLKLASGADRVVLGMIVVG